MKVELDKHDYATYKRFHEIVCILHVLCFPGSAEKPLIAPRFGCLQCSEISARRSGEILYQIACVQSAFGAQIFLALRALFGERSTQNVSNSAAMAHNLVVTVVLFFFFSLFLNAGSCSHLAVTNTHSYLCPSC